MASGDRLADSNKFKFISQLFILLKKLFNRSVIFSKKKCKKIFIKYE
jgi:hypothetical protein